MSAATSTGDILSELDPATGQLLRVAATVAASDEQVVRIELQRAAEITPHQWIEELLLQTYLFAGFPRALNGMREWRRMASAPAMTPSPDRDAQRNRRDGERTCALVYGTMYDKLRQNIMTLHPLLDDWMIVEGYGKVLSRPALDLPRRELCIVAACAATSQDRQLQSHLHGALNVRIAPAVVTAALVSLREVIPAMVLARAVRLWDRIRSRAE